MEEALGKGPSLGSQIKKILDHTLNVKISSVSQFIAPQYNHDRCERSVQMRIYTMSKQQFAVVFTCFFILFSLFILIGLAGPPITSTRSGLFSQLNNSTEKVNYATGPFVLRTPQLSPYCQQLWVIAKILTNDKNSDSVFQSTFTASVDVDGISDKAQSLHLATGNRSHKLKCQNGECDNVNLIHLGSLQYITYKVTIRFNGLKSFDQKFGIRDIMFFFKSYNPAFSKLEIWFRFVFVIFSFGASVWFYQMLRPYPVFFWSMEQKWMVLLLPLLLLYDNPIFPMIFLTNGWFPAVADGLFQATFLCSLMLFWLCIYHGIRQSTRNFSTFYLPKLGLVGSVWVSAVVLSGWDRINELRDPGWYGELNPHNFQTVKNAFYISGGLYLIYLLYLLIRAYGELRNLPYFDLRLKFFTILMLFVMAATTLLTALKFGVAPTLEDNFVSQLSTQYANSAEFVSIYALLNFYLYVMAFVYSPNLTNVVADYFLKEGACDTLINDSEDDMIYGSEYNNHMDQQQRLLNDQSSDEN